MGRFFVKLSNTLTRLRGKRVRPENLLLLFPSCLQNSECKCAIVKDIRSCRHDGRCKVGPLIELADRYGVQVAAASGGELAKARVKAGDVKAVVAIACESELRMGALGIFPKAVLSVVNMRPHGPCVDTDVDLGEVEAAIRWFVRGQSSPPKEKQ